MDAYFAKFNRRPDGLLSIDEFTLICHDLFRNDKGEVYELEKVRMREIFDTFDTNHDGLIDLEEFKICWERWIQVCKRPRCAFLIVDVQNDFICGAFKACFPDGDSSKIIEPINHLLNTVPFDSVFYSLDWHPANHVSFIENLHLREVDESSEVSKEDAKVYDTVTFKGKRGLKQRLWPRHCVQDTWGAELHKDLKIVDNAIKIYKGMDPEVDSYSVFWDDEKLSETTLSSQLQDRGITDIFMCGLAFDICVNASALDALKSGYRTIVIDDCSYKVNHVDSEVTKATIIERSGVITTSNQVKAMVEGLDRRPELGYKLAMEIKRSSESSIKTHE